MWHARSMPTAGKGAFHMAGSARLQASTILFGAFDRHNFGDLLFPHIVARMLRGQRLHVAGLAARDMRTYGGHNVGAIGAVLAQALSSGDRARPNIVHVGGELLTCDAYEAAVMLAPPARVQEAIDGAGVWSRGSPEENRTWARMHLGVPALAPYVFSKSEWPGLAVERACFNAVGGTDLDTRGAALRAEVEAALQAADFVSVRDRQTQACLGNAGIVAPLCPDPAVMVAPLFGKAILRHARRSAVRGMVEASPRGYAAVQFGADFGDDATLDDIARELDRIADSCGLGVVLFRAGAAPWHDDLDCYRRLAARVRRVPIRLFSSLNIWDICALVASSRVYCGSSLHGRIVAMSFGLPRVNLVRSRQHAQRTKQAAFAATWEPPGVLDVVDVQDICHAVAASLGADQRVLAQTARGLAGSYRTRFAGLRATLM